MIRPAENHGLRDDRATGRVFRAGSVDRAEQAATRPAAHSTIKYGVTLG
jgi:hypothetical protein